MFEWGGGEGILNASTYITGKIHLNLLAEYILPDLVTKSSIHCQPPFFSGTLRCEEEVDRFPIAR